MSLKKKVFKSITADGGSEFMDFDGIVFLKASTCEIIPIIFVSCNSVKISMALSKVSVSRVPKPSSIKSESNWIPPLWFWTASVNPNAKLIASYIAALLDDLGYDVYNE